MSGTSNDKLYELINAVRLEMKGDISQMRKDLSKQIGEVGSKLDSMEERTNKLEINQATTTTKMGVLGFIGASVIGAIVSIGMGRLWR